MITNKLEKRGIAFRFSDVSYFYDGMRALCEISLECREGEWLAIVGRNGSGKSTLIKFLNALLTPSEGNCCVFGLDTSDPQNVIEIRKRVAMVFQNPESQIVGVTVEDDAAFALENLCIPSAEIDERITVSLAKTGLLNKRRELTHYLSGGEKQRLALAGALAQGAEMFIFDEATSMLDPEGRAEMQALFRSLHDEGKTIVQVTHDPEEAGLADRVIMLGGGRVCSFNNEMFERRTYAKRQESLSASENKISVKSLSHSYSNEIVKNKILRDVSFDFPRGTVTSLVGRTGSGKSTLIQYLNALSLTEPGSGDVFIDDVNVKVNPRSVRRRVGMVFQHPEQQLFEQTVREELCFALKNWEIPEELHQNMMNDALRQMGLGRSMLERCPFQLSGGEMRRVAIASVLVYKPEWIVLDEPSAGLDMQGKDELAALLDELRQGGTGVFVVTHDRDFAFANSDRVIELTCGRACVVKIQ